MKAVLNNDATSAVGAVNDNESHLARDAADLGRRAHIKRHRNEDLLQYALRLQGLTYWLAFDAHWLLKHAEQLYDARPSNRPAFDPSKYGRTR